MLLKLQQLSHLQCPLDDAAAMLRVEKTLVTRIGP